MADHIFSLKLPKTFKVLQTVEDVVAEWGSLCAAMEGVGGFETADDERMVRVLTSLKALLPWGGDLWCSLYENALGVGGVEVKGVVHRVALVEVDEELEKALGVSGGGWERLLVKRVCDGILKEQVGCFERLVGVVKGVVGLLQKNADQVERAVVRSTVEVSYLLMGRSVIEAEVLAMSGGSTVLGAGGRKSGLVEWEEPQEEVEDPLYWRISVKERLGGIAVNWTVSEEEGSLCSLRFKVGKADARVVEWEISGEVVQEVERERDTVKAYSLMC